MTPIKDRILEVKEEDLEKNKVHAEMYGSSAPNVVQSLTNNQKYEVEIYKQMKRDKYFQHYLDNVLKRREDELVQAMANFAIHPLVMVASCKC